jgi:hypothetical protein
MSNQPLATLSYSAMMGPYDIPVLSAGNVLHVHHFTSFWEI